MQRFNADLHIHTVLSPCGSLEMSPLTIVSKALEANLAIIAITDHNSTRQVGVIKELGKENGLFVIGGVEVTSAEEVHCLALFDTDENLSVFQRYLDKHLLKIKNKADKFGYQVVVDRNERILYEEPWLLINALDTSILEIERTVHSLGGLFIPAHIDRPFNGIISQLGFIPKELQVDALELSERALPSEWENSSKLPADNVFLKNSDAHRPCDIGKNFTTFELEEISFEAIRKVLVEAKNRHSNKPVNPQLG